MAKIIVEKVKVGYENSIFKYYNCISNIIVEDNDEVIELPSHYNGEAITHLGYSQDVIEAHEHFHDYHHPSQGSEWREKEYKLAYIYFDIPSTIKKIIVPETITNINSLCFDRSVGLDLEIDSNNSRYYSKNRQIYYKANDYLFIKLK